MGAAIKLSPAQHRFLEIVDGRAGWFDWNRRRMKDGTVMPLMRERRTVQVLVSAGVLRWVYSGRDGFMYNGVVRAKKNHEK